MGRLPCMMDQSGEQSREARRGFRLVEPRGLSKGIVVDELNRDLLVAVLALLTDAIPRPSLSAALSAWSKDRKQSLAQRLLRDGALDAARLRALECLAEAHLKGHHNDLGLCLNAWNAQGLTQEVLTEIGDMALCTTLGMSPGGNSTLPVTRA